ncbi:MAG: ABC transporter ATP-binding protein [Eubacteriales bacterium]
MEDNVIVELKNITVNFDGEKVLNGIDLSICDKEFVTILGPSGCGKSTTLRVIAGFVDPDAGDVLFDGKRINDIPAHKRQVNTIFQRYALFPHLNVFENVAFGLRVQKIPENEIQRRVKEMLATVSLTGFERRSVNSLSGGQQQRVAIARAVINNPKVLLLDEPLSALDLKLRKEMQTELKKIQQRLNITFLFVTHDQEEALTMSDRVVVMNAGEIMQIGTPQDIYNEPVNAFVADFIGESNIVSGIMKKDYLVSFSGADFECVDSGFPLDRTVDVVVRPEDVKVVSPEKGKICGTVTHSTFKGVHYEMTVEVQGDEWPWLIHSTKTSAVGEKIGMTVDPADIQIMKKSDIPLFSDLPTDELSGEDSK